MKKLCGPLQVAAVRAPALGDQRKSMLQGIAILTEGRAITEGLDTQLTNIKISDLGLAAKITIGKNNTVVEAKAAYDQRIRILAPPQARTGAGGMSMYRNEALLQTLSEGISDCSAAD